MVMTSPTVNLGSWDCSIIPFSFKVFVLFCNQYILFSVILQPKNCMFNIQGRAIASESLKDEEVRVTPCHLHDFLKTKSSTAKKSRYVMISLVFNLHNFLKTNSSSPKKSRFVIPSFVFNLVDSLPAQFCFIVLFRQRFPPTQHPPPIAIPLHHLPEECKC